MKKVTIFFALILSAFSVNAQPDKSSELYFEDIVKFKTFGQQLVEHNRKLLEVKKHLEKKALNLNNKELVETYAEINTLDYIFDKVIDVSIRLDSALIVAKYEQFIRFNVSQNKIMTPEIKRKFGTIKYGHRSISKETFDKVREEIKSKRDYITKMQVGLKNTTAVVTINEIFKLFKEMETFLESKQY